MGSIFAHFARCLILGRIIETLGLFDRIELDHHHALRRRGARRRERTRVDPARGRVQRNSTAALIELLRALQHGEIERLGGTQVRKVDVRVVAATNVDLEAAVASGRFRRDLMYRLNVYPIRIPALRERVEDIEPLAMHLLRHYAALHNKRVGGCTDRALDAMRHHAWPGNVRELENLIERGVILCGSGEAIDVDDLFPTAPLRDGGQDRHGVTVSADGHLERVAPAVDGHLLDQVLRSGLSLDALEDSLIQEAVARSKGNLAAAARTLGLSRPQLRYRLARVKERLRD